MVISLVSPLVLLPGRRKEPFEWLQSVGVAQWNKLNLIAIEYLLNTRGRETYEWLSSHCDRLIERCIDIFAMSFSNNWPNE